MKVDEYRTSVSLSQRPDGLKLSVVWGKDFARLLDLKGWTHFVPHPRISSTMYGTLEPFSSPGSRALRLERRGCRTVHAFKFQRKKGGVVHAEIPIYWLGLVVGILDKNIEVTTFLHRRGHLQLRTPTKRQLKSAFKRFLDGRSGPFE